MVRLRALCGHIAHTIGGAAPARYRTVGKGGHSLTPWNGHAMLRADLLMHAFALSIMRAELRLPARNRVAAW